ncbi:virulence RhuM family protein [Tessaracoccus sp. OH4464_COT-324]|uniref:virulence RhuM family protein n=1 Tax=Tessaracoccus sp. OH4464_COT-324 TaxID=2491059 RepID=UPI000F6411B7|nr:virulence RhuM family protein [Tessaracoccus sp. OH4464_COT-324]RRD45179.1 cell filamentation protein Fic [Tessaracoccus sp. OH4464_COT-324]
MRYNILTQDSNLLQSSGKLIRNSTVEFLIFTSQEGGASIEARYEDDTVWLSQKLMAELFGTSRENITLHLRNIYDSGELEEMATCKDFLQIRKEGSRQVKRRVVHYNLDAIISVGYRVNSVRATQFRQWATKVLRDFAIRGYVIDRQRMENGTFLGEDYFERLLEEIREIRLSECRFYQKVADIYATSVDYNKDAPITKRFFDTVQNKLHYAVHGQTAAELIQSRADAAQPHMGLTTWAGSPDGKILRSDVTIGKNYLTREELEDLGCLVNAFLDLAESRARRRIPMTMEDWSNRLDAFLNLDDRQILDNAGSVSKSQANDHALNEFEKFRIVQDQGYLSDFDRLRNELEEEA